MKFISLNSVMSRKSSYQQIKNCSLFDLVNNDRAQQLKDVPCKMEQSPFRHSFFRSFRNCRWVCGVMKVIRDSCGNVLLRTVVASTNAEQLASIILPKENAV